MPPVIELKGLEHSYRSGTPVLKDVDLKIEQGEMVTLIGLSGAGKSTLLRCINGLLTPTAGELEVLGRQVPRLPEGERIRLRRRIGMIFQEFNLVDRLSALKNVLIGRLGYTSTARSCFHLFAPEDVSLARECLANVGLAGYEHRR